tara:strand:- start:4572 stop:5912 length:1341 start_codon:yes stop_codon:yes gene_type:complete
MYYSEFDDNFIYRWTQDRPEINSHKPDIYCNGKPCKNRNWRTSREDAANMAFKWSRSTEHLLSSLGENSLIFKGCLSMPEKDLDDWRQFKITFNRYRRRWEQQSGHVMAIVAKQHITIKRGQVDGYKDDMHYDYIAYTDAPLSISEIRELILSWIDKSGGNRSRSSCIEIQNRSADNLQRVCDYNFKSPNTKAIKDKFLRFAPLPSTRMPVTWVMGDFWQCKTQVITATIFWNDELIAKERKLCPMDQVWLNWIKSVCGDDIPRFTTEDHRMKIMADKLAEAEFSWDHFLNNCPDFEDDEQNRPITYTLRNSDISSSQNSIQISENTANNESNQDVNKDSLKNTLQLELELEPAICFAGYALQPTDDGNYALRVGKSGKIYDPEPILGDDFHLLSRTFRLDQIKRIVTGLGHEYHEQDEWKKFSIVRTPWHKIMREQQRQRAEQIS